ncbi:N-acetyltransferase [Colletotrichum melonis]|uniref:N-acetyltransferase n=1 Tax=Colletotrichum melonis TaxID=1209925 RepID=A0AAI9UAB3_9PEZI|nr:N-acetyltransferase [Colletotrichum melonis]
MRLNEHTGMYLPHPRHFCSRETETEMWRDLFWGDNDIQEATASEPLTLEEEYENQQSWRTSHDKLTFIICQPLDSSSTTASTETVQAGEVDASERMIGDINFFIYPYDDDDNEDAEGQAAAANEGLYVGEVDVMVASKEHRGRGIGHAAVTTLLTYVHRNKAQILEEYVHGGEGGKGTTKKAAQLKGLMVKIKEGNAASIALFRRLGFVQKGEVNYFGEIQMVLGDMDEFVASSAGMKAADEYREVSYSR